MAEIDCELIAMNIANVRFFEDKKFMWDNVLYETKEEAENVKNKYENDKFEVRLVEQDNKYVLYTRRVVTEVKVEGAPPA